MVAILDVRIDFGIDQEIKRRVINTTENAELELGFRPYRNKQLQSDTWSEYPRSWQRQPQSMGSQQPVLNVWKGCLATLHGADNILERHRAVRAGRLPGIIVALVA
jgi:hypothetical protein